MAVLNRNSKIPFYFQLQEDLKKKLNNGIYKEGEIIPTENELQKIYSVSRVTVRNAIQGLVFEGLLLKKQGIGTIVARRKMIEDFSKLKSFTEKMKEQNVEIDTKVLEVNRISISERIAKHLAIKSGENVICVKRIRLADNEPIALFTNYLREDLGIDEDEDFSGSMYELLENKYGIKISSGEKIIEAAAASDEEAEYLNIKIGDPMLIIRITTFNDLNEPIEYAEGIYRSDRYQYRIKLKR